MYCGSKGSNVISTTHKPGKFLDTVVTYVPISDGIVIADGKEKALEIAKPMLTRSALQKVAEVFGEEGIAVFHDEPQLRREYIPSGKLAFFAYMKSSVYRTK
jgi:hypothetical protein